MGKKKDTNERIDTTRRILAGRITVNQARIQDSEKDVIGLGDRIQNLERSLEPLESEHYAREERRERAMAAHRRRRVDGWEPPYARMRRRVEALESKFRHDGAIAGAVQDAERARQKVRELDKQVNGTIDRAAYVAFTDGTTKPLEPGCMLGIKGPGLVERVASLELDATEIKARGFGVRVRTMELGQEYDRIRLASLEKFQRRVVAAGYAFGLFAGFAAIYFVAQALGALCG